MSTRVAFFIDDSDDPELPPSIEITVETVNFDGFGREEKVQFLELLLRLREWRRQNNESAPLSLNHAIDVAKEGILPS